MSETFAQAIRRVLMSYAHGRMVAHFAMLDRDSD
jgi:hypothetical protein